MREHVKSFNCLDPETDILGFHLLEASAGTGKTFAIEHLFARFSLKVDISQILVVTFTKVATAELKERIFQNLEKSLYAQQTPYDYFTDISNSKEHLREAVLNFDDAQIFTIHGFCQRMLQENFLQANVYFSGDFSKEEGITALQRYFRENFSNLGIQPFQFQLLLKHFKGIKGLCEKLITTFSQEKSLLNKTLMFSEELEEKLTSFSLSLDIKSVYENCLSFFSSYKKTGYNLDELKEELELLLTVLQKKAFSEGELNLLLKSKGSLLKFFSEQNKKIKCQALQEPIITWAQQNILPFLCQGVEIANLFAILKRSCHDFLKNLLEKEGLFSPDRILEKMQIACQMKEFVQEVSSKYKVLIIDEFQDTDPVQWNIFETLFLKNNELLALYLVGDPKQSIYRFRKADLYTYLQAQRAVGKDCVYQLTDNFRSQKNLISSLNAFFDHTFAKKWLALPKLNSHLDYHPVNAKKEEKPFIDHLAPLHFFVCEEKGKKTFPSREIEEKSLFPFIYKEIVRLKDEGFFAQDFTILVKDRFQAKRVCDFMEKRNVSCVSKSVIDIRNSPVFPALREIFEAVVFFPDASFIKKMLLGSFFSLEFSLVEQIEKAPFYSEMIQALSFLKETLEEKGLSSFFHHLLQTDFLQAGGTILDNLSLLDKSYVFDFGQLIEIILERGSQRRVFLETIFSLFDEIENLPIEEHNLLKRKGFSDKNAVQVMTIHMSKGLEFGVVFALGLASRVNPDQSLTEEERLELDAEKMRQLYVALTRAKNRVYVPYVIDQKPRTFKIGEQSAIELFFQNALNKKALSKVDFQEGMKFLSDKISINFLEKQEIEEQEQNLPSSYLFENTPLKASSKKILSFSSLFSDSKEKSYLFDEKKYPELEAPLLPPGTNTGIVLHDLLEKILIDPHLQKEEKLFSFIQRKLQRSSLKGFKENIFNILKKTLDSPIFQTFNLRNLSTEALQTEMEVFYPLPNGQLMQGILDLAFYYKGKYYLVDWKSNLLQDYSPEFLEEEVQKHRYDLQASIYTEAFRRYLEKVERVSFKDSFGGYYLIFLRGLLEDKGVYKVENLLTNEEINAILSSRK